MAFLAQARFTLLIPTFNRPTCLRSLLGYLVARGFRYPIRVLDSSSADALSQNRHVIGQSGLDISHLTYDFAIPVTVKFALGVGSVETPYCSFCADDDILLTTHLDRVLDFLDANPAFAAAHGNYINFKPGDQFGISDIFYAAPSIAAGDALRRIVEQMSNYQAIFYAVHRTSVLRFAMSQLKRVHSPLARELLSSSLTLVAGGVCRLQHFYMARNTGPSITTDGWHPYNFLADKPALLFREYDAYRTVVVEQLLADPQCRETYQPEQIERVLDLVHLKYLAPMMSPQVVDYVLAESLRPGNEPRKIMEKVRDRFEGASASRGSIQGWLNHLGRALREPRHAVELLVYAVQLVRMFATLGHPRNLKIRVTSGFDNLLVDRIARDGRPRRYALFAHFLRQKMPGGRRVTAAETNAILEQLDDYV